MAPAPATQGTCRGRIAILDDQSDVRFLLRAILEPRYTIYDFENVDDMLNFLRQNECDLVLSDLSMPVRDGFDFIQVLRKDPGLRHIPVIALTADGCYETRAKAVASGFAEYLAKPFEPDTLQRLVARRLKATRDA